MQNEWKLDPISFNTEFKNKCKIFDINEKDVKFYSQQDEEKYIIQYLLKEKITDGTFLEVGGCDGILYNNTKTLEDFFNFTGILIEPQPSYFKRLVVNRPKCLCFNYAISCFKENKVEFIGDNACGGILQTQNTNINKWPHWKPYYTPNISLSNLINTKTNFTYIDFMIIDVEGGEVNLLKSFDFDIDVFCIIIEAHSNQDHSEMMNILYKNGFVYKERQRGNQVWINHNSKRKHLFNT